MTASIDVITKQTTIPDLLLHYPQARSVLDRYGLRGCGGKLGPVETLEFFSRAHDVPLESMLAEIQEVLNQNQVLNENHSKSASISNTSLPVLDNSEIKKEDSIYRSFFSAGIVIALTAGALWGVYLLFKIGFSGSFTAVGIHEVNAHGHAQIFGWVGLFVMGFAYQAFPRFKHTALAYPNWAFATLWMMLLGITSRVILEPLGETYPSLWNAAIALSFLEIAAISIFIWIILTTLRRSGKPFEFYDWYILCALAWFFVQGVYSALLFAATVHAATPEALLRIISIWQAPLREIQIHGFAMLMILGVSQRLFHNFYGFRKPNPTVSFGSLTAINISLLGIVFGFVLMRMVSHAWVGLWYSSVLLLCISVVVLVHNWRIFEKPAEHDRSLKFLRMAYIWLHISLAMLALLPVYQLLLLPNLAPGSEAVSMGFSHAYYGAIRHAVTVGFISMMIVGVASKVVPTLNGVAIHHLSALWIPFWLINAGCAFRVAGQTLTDFFPGMFFFIGFSGVLELSGLMVWGFHIFAIMTGRVTTKAQDSISLRIHETITEKHKVGDVLQLYPHLLDEFVQFGFTPLTNPVLRRTVARAVSIESACRKLDVNTNILLNRLNERKQQTAQTANNQELYQVAIH